MADAIEGVSPDISERQLHFCRKIHPDYAAVFAGAVELNQYTSDFQVIHGHFKGLLSGHTDGGLVPGLATSYSALAGTRHSPVRS